jgi:hypothetical protein
VAGLPQDSKLAGLPEGGSAFVFEPGKKIHDLTRSYLKNAPFNRRHAFMTLHQLEIEHKVIDSDGTVLITRGNLIGYLHVDLKELSNTEAALIIVQWIVENGINIVNIDGPMISEDPKLYETIMIFTEWFVEGREAMN